MSKVVVPLTEEQIDELGFLNVKFVDTAYGKFAAALVTASDLSRGLKRWEESEEFDPIIKNPVFRKMVADSQATSQEFDKSINAHTNTINEMKASHADELQKLQNKLTIEHHNKAAMEAKIERFEKQMKELNEASLKAINNFEQRLKGTAFRRFIVKLFGI